MASNFYSDAVNKNLSGRSGQGSNTCVHRPLTAPRAHQQLSVRRPCKYRAVVFSAGLLSLVLITITVSYFIYPFVFMNPSETATSPSPPTFPDSQVTVKTIPSKRPPPGQGEGESDAAERYGSGSDSVIKRQRVGLGAPYTTEGHSTYVLFVPLRRIHS
jgi:hypothetical protein